MPFKSSKTMIASFGLVVLFAALVACSPTASTPTKAPTTVSASPTPEATVESTVEATAETTTEATSEATTEATTEVTAESTSEATAESTAAVQAASADCTRLNLNEETEDQLMSTIPNFSSRMVREFMEYRPYVSIQQFRREIGKYVDAAQVAEWEQYVYVPVDPNNSDADTLKQIPGVDDAVAATLIAGRPYADNQAFVDALGKSLSADQLAAASCYLAASA